MTLYEINKQLADAIAHGVNPETGELENLDEVMELQLAHDEKVENIALYVKNLRAECEAIKTEEQRLKERRERSEKKAERLTVILESELAGEKFSTARCNISYRKSKSLDVADEQSLLAWLERNGHEDCINRKASVAKSAVTKLIEGGADVPFAAVAEHNNMRIQ